MMHPHERVLATMFATASAAITCIILGLNFSWETPTPITSMIPTILLLIIYIVNIGNRP